MGRGIALILTLVVGALVAFQPPANAELGRAVGPLGAAFVSLLVSTTIIGCLLLVAGAPGELGALRSDFQPVWLLGGIAGAAIVSVSLITVRPLGAGGVAVATVCTQVGVSALLDRLGVLGLEPVELSWGRVLGLVLVVLGTVLVVTR